MTSFSRAQVLAGALFLGVSGVVGFEIASSDGSGRHIIAPRIAQPPPIEVVSADDADRPPHCRVRQAAERLRDFATALTAGDARRAARPFAPEPDFRWYAAAANRAGEREVPKARRTTITVRRRLPDYFAARSRQNEVLRLRTVKVVFHEGETSADVAFLGVRLADDLRAGQLGTSRVQGRGSVRCATGAITALSVSMDHYGASRRLCPDRRPGNRNAIVACD
jgi:hypothetical protein